MTWLFARSELQIRILSALTLIPIIVALAWLGGAAFSVLMIVISVAMYWEWTVMTQKRIEIHRDATAIIACVTLLIATHLYEDAFPSLVSFMLIGFGYILVRIWKVAAGWTIAGIGVGASLGCCLIFLRNVDQSGFSLLVFLCFCVWAADSSAYAIGRMIGGPKLMPSVSPNKTWSGFFASILGAVCMSVIVLYLLFGKQSIALVVFAGLIACAAQIGDLIESRIKRLFNKSDSSQLIPGHGGVLDRVDGLVFAAYVFTTFHVLNVFKFDG